MKSRDNSSLDIVFNEFFEKVQALGLDLKKDEVIKEKVFEVKVLLRNNVAFSLYFDTATSAWLHFDEFKEGSDELVKEEHWEKMLRRFYDIVESITKRPFTKVNIFKKGNSEGGYIIYKLPDNKSRKLTDLKLHFWGFGKARKVTEHPPLEKQFL